MDLLPRFRGNAVELENGWGWECIVTPFGSNEEIISFRANDVFPDKEAAIKDMMKAIKLACDDLQEKFMGESNGTYIDMKTNETLKWDKKEYN